MEGAFERPIAHPLARHIPKPKRVEWLGTPVRDEIAARAAARRSAIAGRAGPLRLLVVGGSLGAQTMNDLVLAALKSMAPDERPQVVHQAGAKLHDKLAARLPRGGRRGARCCRSSTTWRRATRGATC